jgi:glutathione peroxidase
MNVHDFTAKSIDGKPVSLGQYKGRWMLVVNVASKCGLTPQYEGLEALSQKYQGKGLTVLGFPCNQFGAQEPGTEKDIQTFCSTNYNVTFPMFSKVEVNGDQADPLFKHLKEKQPGDIKWNFNKFLVDPKGDVVKRYEPKTTPAEIDADLAGKLA